MSEFDVGNIVLQLDDEIPFTFLFPVATTATKNDGCLPFGTVINSVIVKVIDEDLEDGTIDFIDTSPTLAGEKVTVKLKYPGTGKDGRYKITFYLTLSNGSRQFDFRNLYVRTI